MGRQVTVRGVADDAVEVEEEAVIDVRRMRVSSVESTGEACATAS